MVELAMGAFLAAGGAGLILFVCSVAMLAIVYRAIFGQFFDV